jgi:hypothetical protein
VSKLSRIILGAVVVTAISPVLAVTPASAATTVTATTVATSAPRGAVTSPTAKFGLCRIFPKLCVRSSASVGGSAA